MRQLDVINCFGGLADVSELVEDLTRDADRAWKHGGNKSRCDRYLARVEINLDALKDRVDDLHEQFANATR